MGNLSLDCAFRKADFGLVVDVDAFYKDILNGNHPLVRIVRNRIKHVWKTSF
jgi:hypothetical protein